MFWTAKNSMWTPFRPFTVTTHSTMSYDAGDINNDGRMEIFATDMMPYADEADYAWQPILEAIRPAGAQVMENILQIHAGAYVNRAAEMGLQAVRKIWQSGQRWFSGCIYREWHDRRRFIRAFTKR